MAQPENSGAGILVLVPTRGTSQQLVPLVAELMTISPERWKIVVSVSSDDRRTFDKVATDLEPYREGGKVTVVSSPLGYSSARNAAFKVAPPTFGYLFIDDDVHITMNAIHELDRSVTNPPTLLGIRVDRRLDQDSRLFRACQGKPPAPGAATSLSGGILYVPVQAVVAGAKFPVELDRIGSEDTSFTMSCRAKGFPLILSSQPDCYECVYSSEITPMRVVSRLMSNRAALRALSVAGFPETWNMTEVRLLGLGISLVARVLSFLAAILPTYGVIAARAVGRMLGRFRVVVAFSAHGNARGWVLLSGSAQVDLQSEAK